MKAAVQFADGLRIEDIEVPRPGPEEVLVKVRACGLNRADLSMLAGRAHGAHGGAGTVLGLEWSGVVEEVGASVVDFAPGDRVMGSGKGAFADYAVSDHGRVTKIPTRTMSFEQAAALPVALQTMHDAVVTNGRLRSGEAVLIQGASSGVGLMGLQIAKLLGAGLVIGTSSTAERRERLKDFGAQRSIDTMAADWPQQVMEATEHRGVDLIVDQLSGTQAINNLRACALKARIVNVGRLAGSRAEFDFDLHALKRIEYIGVTFRTRTVEEVREINRRMRADLGPAISDGRLSLPIDRCFAFAELRDALAYMARNAHFGKIVVAMP